MVRKKHVHRYEQFLCTEMIHTMQIVNEFLLTSLLPNQKDEP